MKQSHASMPFGLFLAGLLLIALVLFAAITLIVVLTTSRGHVPEGLRNQGDDDAEDQAS